MSVVVDQRVWSKSQVALLKECKRKWHFHSRGKDQDVLRLKKVKNRYLWVGNIIHTAVGDIVKLLRQNAAVPDIELFLNTLKEKMRAEFVNSKENVNNETERLFEHEYKIQISPQVWKDQWEKVEKSIRWFVQSPWFKRLQEMPAESWKTVDEVLSFQVDEVKAYVKIDCALEIENRFILIDWKTSALKETDKKDAMMMALYAHEVWGAEPEQITLSLVSLADGKSQSLQVTEEEMMDAFLRIQDEGNILTEEASSLTENPFDSPVISNKSICRQCNFQKLCYPKGELNDA